MLATRPASVYLEGLLELDDQLPVRPGHLVLEVTLEDVDALAADAAHQRILSHHTSSLDESSHSSSDCLIGFRGIAKSLAVDAGISPIVA